MSSPEPARNRPPVRAAAKLPRRKRSELEFLPAAVEILETPPSPTGRLLAMALCAFLAIAIGWAWIGKINVVAVAEGRIVPSGYSKVIQPLETSVIKAIHVQDGQSVRQGEVLVELDPTAPAADLERINRELMEAGIVIARLRATLASGESGSFAPPKGADANVLRVHRELMAQELAQQAARLQAIDREIEGNEADGAAITAEIKKLQQTVPMMRERVKARKTLVDKDLAPRMDLLEMQEQLVQQEQDLVAAKARLKESSARIAGAQQQRAEAEAAFRHDRLTELAEAEQRLAALTQELRKVEQRRGLQRLMAPVDGVVQQLAVHTVGGVVTEAQQLMVIVPEQRQLEIEAVVLNKDVGFVAPGQRVAIKFETFLFTRYGTIEGQVIQVSSDAIQDQQRGLIYAARIAMGRTTMEVDGKTVNLTPGMAATVEIQTGERRLIDYLLSPLLRYRDESMRER